MLSALDTSMVWPAFALRAGMSVVAVGTMLYGIALLRRARVPSGATIAVVGGAAGLAAAAGASSWGVVVTCVAVALVACVVLWRHGALASTVALLVGSSVPELIELARSAHPMHVTVAAVVTAVLIAGGVAVTRRGAPAAEIAPA
jgi:hypothetical protein